MLFRAGDAELGIDVEHTATLMDASVKGDMFANLAPILHAHMLDLVENSKTEVIAISTICRPPIARSNSEFIRTR